MKEEIKEKIGEVLQVFVEQELGNKITHFNMQGLLIVLMSKVDALKEKESEVKKSK